jgi:hypothetical protein
MCYPLTTKQAQSHLFITRSLAFGYTYIYLNVSIPYQSTNTHYTDHALLVLCLGCPSQHLWLSRTQHQRQLVRLASGEGEVGGPQLRALGGLTLLRLQEMCTLVCLRVSEVRKKMNCCNCNLCQWLLLRCIGHHLVVLKPIQPKC